MKTANEILSDAAGTLTSRGPEYDKPEGERSAAHAARIFNAITGRDLTEFEAWVFMQALKQARMMANPKKMDTYVDLAGYAALAGECAQRAQSFSVADIASRVGDRVIAWMIRRGPAA